MENFPAKLILRVFLVLGKVEGKQLELDGEENFMESRIDIDLVSVFVASELNLNWGSCRHCSCAS